MAPLGGTKIETNLIDLYEKNVDVNCLKVFRILKNTMSVSDTIIIYDIIKWR